MNTTTNYRRILTRATLQRSVLTVIGTVWLLTVSPASAQTSEDTVTATPSEFRETLSFKSALETKAEDSESSGALEFAAPASTMDISADVANPTGLSLANPSGSLVSGSATRLATGSFAVTTGGFQTNARSTASRLRTYALLGGGLLALGIVAAVAVQKRPRLLT